MDKSRFVTKDGQLRPYALACGYIQRASDTGDSEFLVSCDLGQDGACYHVRGFDHGRRVRLFWESVPTLGEARKIWARKVRELGLKKHKCWS